MTKLKNKKQIKSSSFRSAGLIILILLVVLSGNYLWSKKTFYDSASYEAGNANIRDLVIEAVKEQTMTAPIDPKTGDSYFTEGRLYLPDSHQQKLRYNREDSGVSNQPEVYITSEKLIQSASIKLYDGSVLGKGSTEKVLEAVPNLQACGRAYLLVYNKIDGQELPDYEYSESIALNNGKSLYLYSHTGCSELKDEGLMIDFSKLKTF